MDLFNTWLVAQPFRVLYSFFILSIAPSFFASDQNLDHQNIFFQKPIHRNIVIGICGHGNGHCNRELPIVHSLLESGHRIVVFTFGAGLSFFQKFFPDQQNLTVIEVANPYYFDCREGLDFDKTASSALNEINFIKINAEAMKKASEVFGCPDLIISDYETTSAQFAYIKGVPFITLDQQSMMLLSDLPPSIGVFTSIGEKERLRLFFPRADRRIIASFFKLDNAPEGFIITPPILRPSLLKLKGTNKSSSPTLVVYVSPHLAAASPKALVNVLQNALPEPWTAHIFLPKTATHPKDQKRLFFYEQGDPRFETLLSESHGVIATAGHTLLSEAMFLEKPVLTLPMPLYEQMLNSEIISRYGFGMKEKEFSEESLLYFLENIPRFEQNIKEDQTILFKTTGNCVVLDLIDQILYNY